MIQNYNIDEEEERRAREEAERLAAEAAAQAEADREQAEQNAAEQAAQVQGETPLNPAAPETPNPVYTGVRSKGAGHITAEHRQNIAYTKEVRSALDSTRFQVDTYDIAEGYDKKKGEEDFKRRVAAHALGAPVKEETGNKVSVDYDTIKNKEQGFALLTTYSDNAAKVTGATRMAKQFGMDVETFLAEAENYMYDKFGRNLFPAPYSPAAKNRAYTAGMNEIGLYDVGGNLLDINKATTADILRACRMDPSGETGKTVYKLVKEASKVKGNPWYGMEVTEDMFKFVESSELSSADYKDEIEKYNTSFAYSQGYTDENMSSYLSMYDDIKSFYGDNPRVMEYLVRDLNKSYSEHTGLEPLTREQLDQALAETEELRESAKSGAKTREQATNNVFQAIGGWVSGGIEWLKTIGKKDKVEEPVELKTVDEIIDELEQSKSGASSGGSVISGGGTVSVNGKNVSVSEPIASTDMPSRSELFGKETAELGMDMSNPLGLSDETLNRNKRTEEIGPQYNPDKQNIERLAYDPNMTDAQAWANYQNGYVLAPENLNQISRYTNPEFRGLTYGEAAKNTVSTGSSSASANNAINSYRKHGSLLGEAANTIASSRLDNDTRATAELALMSLAADIYDMWADPELAMSRPAGTNMYDYAFAMDKNLVDRLNGITDSLKTAGSSYSENVVNAQEDRDARAREYTDAILNGNGTQEMLDWMSSYHAQEWVDVYDDDRRNELVNDMLDGSGYFADGGSFWSGNSMAAVEAKNIQIAGGMQGSIDFKQDLRQRTIDIIDGYTQAAHNIGATLEEYLGSAGISGVEQIVNIAYNAMQAEGNALLDDPNTQGYIDAANANSITPEGIALGSNRLSGGDQIELGADIGWTSYWEGMAQAGYVMTDLATHDASVRALQTEYMGKYGLMGAAMYRRDLNAVLASGVLSDDMAAELRANMGRAYSIFDIGYEIDPNGLKGYLRQTQAELGKKLDVLNAVTSTLAPEQQTLVRLTSGLINNVTGMSVSVLTAGVGRKIGIASSVASAVGSAVGTGATTFSNAYDRNVHENGMNSGTAASSAFMEALGMTLIENGNTDSFVDLFFGGASTDSLWRMARKSPKNFAKAMGNTWLSGFVGEGAEEGMQTVAEHLFDIADEEWQAYERGEGFSIARLLGTMERGLKATDYTELGKEVVSSVGAGMAYGAVFGIAGVARSGRMAFKDAQVFNKYESVKLATQIAEGDVEATNENLGKLYSMIRNDLADANYRRYLDKGSVQATKDRMVMTAMLEDTARDTLNSAVGHATKAKEYQGKAEAARVAGDSTKMQFLEIGEAVENGDLEPSEMDTALSQWQKAETAYNEAKAAAEKESEAASRDTKEWLRACQERGGILTSEGMQVRMEQIANVRLGIAKRLDALYARAEQARADYEESLDRDRKAQVEVDYAENAVFADDAETEEDVDIMTDKELDVDVEELNAQIAQAENRIAEASSQREELGIDGETIRALVEQELAPLSKRKSGVVAREKARFNNAFDRMQQALEMDNEDAADQIAEEYEQIGARLRALGEDTDVLIAEQYGIDPKAADAAYKKAQEQDAKRAEDEKRGKLTDDLSRRMEATNASLDTINPARWYFAKNPIYVNRAQAADILAAEGLKSISQFNRRYGTKLTTRESDGAMPLDGHVLSDIASEASGSVRVDGDPVAEMLTVLQSGKKLTATQRAERAEEKTLRETKKAADKQRRANVSALVDQSSFDGAKSAGVKVKPGATPASLREDMELTGETIDAKSTLTAQKQSGVRAPAVKPKTRADLINNNRNTGVANKAEDFSDALDAWDDKTGNLNFVVARTPERLKHLGESSLPDSDIVMNSSKIRVNQTKFHKAMTKDIMKQLPAMLADPIMVMESRTQENRIVVVGELNDADGNPVVAVLSLDTETNKVSGLRTIPMINAYGKDKSKAQTLFKESKYLYLDKNRADAWQVSTGLQLPTEAYQAIDSSTRIVAQGEVPVNSNPNIDAIATGGSSNVITPAQKQVQRSKKLEGSALKAIQNLAKDMKVGLRVKNAQRFNSADARMSKDVKGYYKNGQRNVILRSTDAGRVSVAGHEIGHAIQEQIGLVSNQQMINSWQNTFGNTGAYTPQQYDHEAFAEFFWRYLCDKDSARQYAGGSFVDSFEQALKQKKLYKAVSKAQTQVSAYMASNADAKANARMVDAYKAKTPEDTAFMRRTEIRLIDDTAAAEDFQDVIRKRTGKKSLSLEDNLRDTIRFNRRARARANEILTKALVDENGNYVGESFKDVFSEIKGKDFDKFWEYELVMHSLDRDAAKGAKNQVFDEETFSTDERKAFVEKMRAEHPEFEHTNRKLQAWRRQFLDTYLVKNGYLGSQEQANELLDLLEKTYPSYVPTYRVKSKRDKAAAVGGHKYQTRTATGSTEDVVNPFDSYVSMVNSIVQMVAENDNRKKFAQLYDKYGAPAPGEVGPGVGLFANEITQDMQKSRVSTAAMRKKVEKMLDNIGTDPEAIAKIGEIIGDEKVEYHGTGRVNMNNIITVRNEDGTKRFFEVYNPELFELLAAVAPDQEPGVLDGLAKATRLMSMLTTGSNPVFGLTNMMRDFQASVNHGSWASTYADGAIKWLGALWDVVTNGEASQEYDRLGGGGWTAYDTSTKKGSEELRGEIVKGYNTSNVGRFGRLAGRAIWSVATMQKVNEAIEKTSRLAEYKYGKHDLGTNEGRIEAFLAAQDVTVDFARRGRGRIARDLKSLIPFFNASLQGIYRNGRQITAQESDRAGVRFAKNVVNATLAAALANSLLLAYMDDDEKEEFTYLSDDLKAKHLFLPNFAPEIFGDAPLLRIPLAQDPLTYAVNAAVANAVWYGENDNEFVLEVSAVANVIKDNMNPVGSTILDPAISMLSNKNWYGSDIVPSYLEGYDETNQYTEETPTAFVNASKGLASIGIKVSPMMLQYMAEQYTGYIGQTVIPALPSEKNQYGITAGMLNALVATARKRVTSDPLKSNDVVSTVYDSYDAMNRIYKAGSSKRNFDIDYLDPTLTDRDRRRAIREADDLIHSGGDIYEAKKEISEGYDRIDQINDRDDLTDEEKYTLTSKIRKDMVETALDVQEVMNDYDTRYKNDGIMKRFMTWLFS